MVNCQFSIFYTEQRREKKSPKKLSTFNYQLSIFTFQFNTQSNPKIFVKLVGNMAVCCTGV